MIETIVRFFGEAVVKACVDNGANHVDISGEPQVIYIFVLYKCLFHYSVITHYFSFLKECNWTTILLPFKINVMWLEHVDLIAYQQIWALCSWNKNLVVKLTA